MRIEGLANKDNLYYTEYDLNGQLLNKEAPIKDWYPSHICEAVILA